MGRYRRDLKITTAMFLFGTVGMIILLESESHLSIDSTKPTWMLILLGVVVVLYGFGGLGTFAFALLMGLTAKCPKCNKRFRALRKDWAFCPFCGTDFDQILEDDVRESCKVKVPCLLILVLTCGCSTMNSLEDSSSYPGHESKVYAGTRNDLSGILYLFGDEFVWGALALGELPFCFVADTILLPYTIHLDSQSAHPQSPSAQGADGR